MVTTRFRILLFTKIGVRVDYGAVQTNDTRFDRMQKLWAEQRPCVEDINLM